MYHPKSIISIGLGGPPELLQRLHASEKQILDKGYDYEMVLIDAEDFPSALEKIKERLGSKRWDGVVVGFGIRGNAKHTEIFETVVSTASEIVPGVRFGFPCSPEDVVPCFGRIFGSGG
jgi:hypothetical protein